MFWSLDGSGQKRLASYIKARDSTHNSERDQWEDFKKQSCFGILANMHDTDAIHELRKDHPATKSVHMPAHI